VERKRQPEQRRQLLNVTGASDEIPEPIIIALLLAARGRHLQDLLPELWLREGRQFQRDHAPWAMRGAPFG
jgi:hypothetical protein